MDSPASNQVYNLISMLDNKLEALAAYDKYEKDMKGAQKTLLEQIRDDDKRHAELLLRELENLARTEGLSKS